MATSGSHNFNVTGNDIITESLGLIGIYSPGESIDASESADALRTLNMMLKALHSKFGLWLHRELALFLQDDTISYSIGPTGTHCTPSFIKTEIATAADDAATSVIVDSITGFGNTFDRNGISEASTPTGAGSLTLGGALVTNGIANLSGQRKILIYSDGDDSGVSFSITGQDASGIAVTETITGPNTTTVYSTYAYKTITAVTIDGAGTGNIEVGQVGDPIGIEVDDGTVHWTYISGAVSTTTLTLVTALDDAAAVDNHVYSYTAKTARPIEIIEARLHDANDLERPLGVVGKLDYKALSNKTSEGPPNQIYYDKQLTNGVMYVWPEPDDVQNYIKFTAKVPIEDIDNLTDDFELAQEFYEAIAWNLAVRLAPKYGKPIDPTMLLMARDMLEDAMTSDSENTSTFIQIDRSGHA